MHGGRAAPLEGRLEDVMNVDHLAVLQSHHPRNAQQAPSRTGSQAPKRFLSKYSECRDPACCKGSANLRKGLYPPVAPGTLSHSNSNGSHAHLNA